MSGYAPRPILLVHSGDVPWRVRQVPPGRSAIGRHATSDIVLPDATVSSRHAVIDRNGSTVELTPLRSTNGTVHNGAVLRERVALQVGDRIQLGNVVLTFAEQAHAPGPADGAATSVRIDTVAGPVQSGGGQQFVSGRDQAVHHGDVHNEVRTDIDLSTPWDEAVTGKGIGRLILLLGGLTALAGFALWLWLLLSAQAGGPDPFALEIAGMPAGAVGMGGFAGGLVLAEIGRAVSKAARNREQQALRDARTPHRHHRER